MHDQSHGRINGSAAAAFATICERRLNMASVLKSAGGFRRRVVGMRRRFKIRQGIKANNFPNDSSLAKPFRGVDVRQPLQDNGDLTRSRRFALLAKIDRRKFSARDRWIVNSIMTPSSAERDALVKGFARA
ncbi:MAG: hypothetical protein ACRDHN_12465, partial [Thermomicrobiales bacterium]